MRRGALPAATLLMHGASPTRHYRPLSLRQLCQGSPLTQKNAATGNPAAALRGDSRRRLVQSAKGRITASMAWMMPFSARWLVTMIVA